jgi:hypothetical protein
MAARPAARDMWEQEGVNGPDQDHHGAARGPGVRGARGGHRMKEAGRSDVAGGPGDPQNMQRNP